MSAGFDIPAQKIEIEMNNLGLSIFLVVGCCFLI